MVTQEIWQNDIRVTEDELGAYKKLVVAFKILANLPENIESGKSAYYQMQATKYQGKENSCRDFLNKLYDCGDKSGYKYE